MADVKREQELAERRKHDPQPTDLAQDHLVRKIFSKFRKPSDAGSAFATPRPSALLSKVTPKIHSDMELGKTPDLKITGHDSDTEVKAPIKPKIGISRWAASLAGDKTTTPAIGTENAAAITEKEDKEDAAESASRRTELVCRKSEHIHVVKDIRPPTQGNKWPKVSSSARPETIEETSETAPDKQLPTGQDSTTATGTKQQVTSKTAAGVVSTAVTTVQPKPVTSADLQQLIATLIDMRIDLKLEIQKLNNRINIIDQHMEDMAKKLETPPPLEIRSPAALSPTGPWGEGHTIPEGQARVKIKKEISPSSSHSHKTILTSTSSSTVTTVTASEKSPQHKEHHSSHHQGQQRQKVSSSHRTKSSSSSTIRTPTTPSQTAPLPTVSTHPDVATTTPLVPPAKSEGEVRTILESELAEQEVEADTTDDDKTIYV